MTVTFRKFTARSNPNVNSYKMTSLYDMSIPVYIKALESMIGVLKKGEKWADENKIDHSKLVEARLAPDMNVCQRIIERIAHLLNSLLASLWLSKFKQRVTPPK